MTSFNPRKFVENVGSGKIIRKFHPGDVIFQQGTPAEHVFYLQSGRAKETVRNSQGKEAVVGLLDAGHFFGAAALDGGVIRVSTVSAVTECMVTMITKEAMHRALKEPKFSQLFMAYLLHHNSKIEAEKTDLLFNSREKRLAQRLLLLAHIEDGPAQAIGPEITQEMLAAMIGATRPQTNKFLVKFRKLGFITYNGGIMVQKALLKAVLHGELGTNLSNHGDDP